MRTNFHSTNEIAGKLFVQLWNYTKILYLIIFKSLSWISRLTFCFFNRRPSTGPCGNGTDFVPKGLFYCSQLPSFLHCKILQEKKNKTFSYRLLASKCQTSNVWESHFQALTWCLRFSKHIFYGKSSVFMFVSSLKISLLFFLVMSPVMIWFAFEGQGWNFVL